MASKIIKTTARQVTPVFSANSTEARRRVLNLYKAWYRQIPTIVLKYDVPVSAKECKERLHEMFSKNKSVTDIRVIDLLVIKGQMELVEAVNVWKARNHIMDFFSNHGENKPNDFLSKFYDGHQ